MNMMICSLGKLCPMIMQLCLPWGTSYNCLNDFIWDQQNLETPWFGGHNMQCNFCTCFFWFVKYLSLFVHKWRLNEIFVFLMLLWIYDDLHWGIENLDRLILFVKDQFIDYHVRFVLNLKNMIDFFASKITMIKYNKFMENKGLLKKPSIYFEIFWSSGLDSISFLVCWFYHIFLDYFLSYITTISWFFKRFKLTSKSFLTNGHVHLD